MIRPATRLAALGGLFLASTVSAAPPQITATSPFGVPKGVATEVTVRGANLSGNPQLIAPFGFTTTPPPPAGSDAGNWKFTLTVPPETAIGVYPIRVRTDDGLSNPFLFAVGQLAQVAEKEDNNSFERAQAIASPVVVEGETAGNDVDFFRFPGKKGQKIVVDAQCARIGSGVDPTIRLSTAARTYVASADDTPGLLTDARLTATLPEDGDYVIELSDTRYQGGGRPVYRLVVGSVPIADEVYPISGRKGETVGFEFRGGTMPDLRTAAARITPAGESDVLPIHVNSRMLGLDTPPLDVESLPAVLVSELPELREPADPAAAPVRAAVPVILNGRIDPAGDEDRFTLAVTPGQALRIEVDASDAGSALDGVLRVLGAKDALLATADDTTIPAQGGKKGKAAGIVSPDPSLNFTVPGGVNEITLALKDLGGRGGVGFAYRISVEPVAPGFELALNDPQVSVPKGGTAVVGVTVARKGYTGPITLGVSNLPAGLTVRPGTIAAGQVLGAFSLSAAADASFGATVLDVTGQGDNPSGPLVSHGLKHIVFAQQGTFPTKTLTQTGLATAPSLPSPVTLDVSATPVEIAHGFGATVPVKAIRSSGADAALAITPLPLPPGLTVAAANLAAKATEANVTVNAAVEAPLGTITIALIAKGKIANADQTIAIPAVTLNVVRPAAVELATTAIEIKPGTTFELKGKLVRKGTFKEPVTLRINGLPAGLKADPATVAPDQSDFTLKVVADAKAAVATVGANVAVAFQVNKKDYPSPTTPFSVKVLAAK